MPAKKKKSQTLENGFKDTNIVQKSRPLLSLYSSSLTLGEFKILDLYLSRINSHDPERRSVVIEKGKLEEIFGVTKINTKNLDERLKHLQSTLVNIDAGEGKIDRITLFERAQGELDENGKWKITLTCTPSALKYVFNIEALGYIRYKIRLITQLRSLNSYIMFTYLEANRRSNCKISSWEIPLDELKTMLRCSSEAYEQYYRFNDLILKRCHQELTEKTTMRYSYEPVRTGRKVTAVRFTLESNTDLLVVDTMNQEDDSEYNGNQNEVATTSQYDEIQSGNAEESYKSENNKFLAGACNYEFNNTQIQELIEIIEIIPRGYLPKGDYCDDISVSRYHYLAQKYAALNTYAEKQKIKNRFAYLKKIIKNDLEDIKSKESESNENYIPSDFV